MELAAAGKAVSRGAALELFSNSPVWWATVNDDPSGPPDCHADNLRRDMVAAHATYMATTAAQLCARHGLCARTVEAFNEPSGCWGADGTQEGCPFSHGLQAATLLALRPAMAAAGLEGTPIAASDESQLPQVRGCGRSTGRARGKCARCSRVRA